MQVQALQSQQPSWPAASSAQMPLRISARVHACIHPVAPQNSCYQAQPTRRELNSRMS